MKTDLNIFVPCPRCAHLLGSLVEMCPSCGLSLVQLDEQIGAKLVVLDDIADPLHLISNTDKANLSKQVEKLRNQIPWLRIIVLTTHLPDPISLEEFLFWLLHRGVFLGKREKETKGVIILGVEAQHEQVGIAAGSEVYDDFPEAKEKFRRLTEVFATSMQMVSPGLAIVEVLERMGRILIVPKTSHETSKAPY